MNSHVHTCVDCGVELECGPMNWERDDDAPGGAVCTVMEQDVQCAACGWAELLVRVETFIAAKATV